MSIQKIDALKKWLQEHNTDIAYISDPRTIAYFSGYSSEPHERVLALFVSADHDPFLFTPALETEDAMHSGWQFPVIGYLDSEEPFKIIAKEITARFGEPKSFAIEKANLSVGRYETLKDAFSGASFTADLTPFIQRMQVIKTEEEIDRLLEAGHWADVAFEIGRKAIKERVTEQELVAEIEYQLHRKGVQSMSFDTLVLTGKNAASPHGTPGKTPVLPKELVLFDLGVIWNGYCSDATRTVAFRQPTDFQKKIYSIVLEAQLEAQNAVKPGVTAGQLDKIARDIIESYGYGEYFNHRLGHGIGTTVHEFPSIVEGNSLILEEGMCFSIEPGIYIPNEVGVRIEDCIAVTKDGCIPFTTTPKELQIIE